MKKSIILLLLVVMVSVFPVYSAPIDSVVLDRDTQMVTITGTTMNQNDPVAIEILKPGREWSELDGLPPQNVLDVLAGFYQVASDENCQYTLTYKADGQPGAYQVRVRFLPEDIAYDDGYVLIDNTEIQAALATMSSENSADALRSFAEQNQMLFGFDFTEYNSLDDDGKTAVWELFIRNRKAAFETVSQVQEAFFEAALVTKINLSDSDEEMDGILSAYAEDFHLKSVNSYDIYLDDELYPDAKRKQLRQQLCAKNDYASIAAFAEYFWDMVVLVGCADNQSWYATQSILDKAEVLADQDLGNYRSLSDKSAVCKSVNVAGVYSSIEKLAQAVSDFSNGTENGSDDSRPGGGGGGGGGGSRRPSSGNGSQDVIYSAPSDLVQQKPESNPYFTDISQVAWAEEAINALYEDGIVSGRGDHRFYPEDPVTREEFVKMLAEVMDLPDEGVSLNFLDVERDVWYYTYIAAACQADIVKGVSEEVFGVGQNITRQDMAVILYRAMEKLGLGTEANVENPFDDTDSIAAYARDAVAFMRSNQMMDGMGDNLFAPTQPVTRAQAAKVIFALKGAMAK